MVGKGKTLEENRLGSTGGNILTQVEIKKYLFFPLAINAIHAHDTTIKTCEKKHIKENNIYTNSLLNLKS